MSFKNLMLCSIALYASCTLLAIRLTAAEKETSNVKTALDLPYADNGDQKSDAKQHLDLFLPEGKRNFPVLMFVHGGGYQKGDRKEATDFGKLVAAQGIGVAAISYRLYPQVKHPDHIQDIARAFAWLKKSAPQYGGDADKIFVSGHSAGAHLVSLLATDEKYLQAEQLHLSDIRGVIALSGGYRILPIRKVVFGDEETMRDASPFSHLGGKHPPFLIVYGGAENKERHELSAEFRDALRKTGCDATTLEIPERDHHGLFTKIEKGEPTLDAIVQFVNRVSARAGK